jgi:hypothetical protein
MWVIVTGSLEARKDREDLTTRFIREESLDIVPVQPFHLNYAIVILTKNM